MKNTILLISIVMLQLTIVNALGPAGENGVNIRIVNNSLAVSGYTILTNPSTGLNAQALVNGVFINNVQASLSSACNAVTVPLIVNGSYTGENTSITPLLSLDYNLDVPFASKNLSTQNQTVLVDLATLEKLNECNNAKAISDSRYISLYNDYVTINNTNVLYVNCVSSLATCNAEKSPLQTQIDTLKKEQEDLKNRPWLFGLGGAALGFAIAMFWTGKWFGQKAKDFEDEFQRSQAA